MYNNLIFLSNPVNGAQLLTSLTLRTFSVGSLSRDSKSRTEVSSRFISKIQRNMNTAKNYLKIWKIREKCLSLQCERRNQVEPRCAERWHLCDDEQFDLAAWFPSLNTFRPCRLRLLCQAYAIRTFVIPGESLR